MAEKRKIDEKRFLEARAAAGRDREQNGIGTLGERTLHALLKELYTPEDGVQEAKVDGFVADILSREGITEIQTGDFSRLRRKLEVFLEKGPVRVVYPVARLKWLCWVDEETGETTPKRKSPKQGDPWEVFRELYKIKGFLRHPGLRLSVVLMDMEEYRLLNGWSRDRKKGSSRCDRIPLALVEEVRVECLRDYERLIPPGVTGTFTSRDFQAASKMSLGRARTALNVLHHVGAVERVGKTGNTLLYQRAEPPDLS